MASHSSLRRQTPCAHSPNWLELPADVWTSILRRLGVVQILNSAQHVCSTWRRICRDPSMWTFISVSMTYDRYSKLYRQVVDLSCGGLLYLNMNGYEPEGPDGLLHYIIDRSKNLRCLRLRHCTMKSRFSDELIEVAEKIPVLEALELSYCYRISSEVVAAVGQLCPLLVSFKLNARGSKCSAISDSDALAIANNMPGLHHLQIFGNKLTNVGLIAILDSCQQLESLDLRHCFHINLDANLERRCREQVKQFRGPNDSTHDYLFKSELYDSDDYENLCSSDVAFGSDCDSG